MWNFKRRTASPVAQADHARDIGEWQLAVQLYRKVLDHDPRDAPVWLRYGDSLKHCGDLALAETAYRTAIVCEPGRADSYRQLGDVLKLQGRDQEANGPYLVAVVLDPSLLCAADGSKAFGGWSEPQVAMLHAMLGNPPPPSDHQMADEANYQGLDWLASGQPANEDSHFSLSISQFTAFNQKLLLSCTYRHRQKRVRFIFVVFSCNIFVHAVIAKDRHSSGYNAVIDIPHGATYQMKLGFEFEDGSRFIVERPSNGEETRESGHNIFSRFAGMVASSRHSHILEVGSRARSGNIYKSFLPDDCKYVGFDIKEGENVDMVGDAHFLSTYFPKHQFDFIYSIAVFEHIMMPWKVAVEINRVMKMGAIGFILSHQAWPLHEEPWDFWRFSDMGWHAIFNRLTGFEVIEAGLTDRACIVPVNFNSITYRLDEGPAYLGSVVLFRKVAESTADWPIDRADLMKTVYPG